MLNRKSFLGMTLGALMTLAAVPALAQEPAEVKVWIAFTDARLDWAKEKAAQFNAQFPQYNVVVEGYPNYEELFTATALANEQGTMPAVVQYFEVATQDARDSGFFKPIAEALAGRTEINGIAADLNDFIGPVGAYYTINGEFTSMPWNTSSAIMFVNKTQLDAAGVESIPATWSEVEAACELINAYRDAQGAEILPTPEDGSVAAETVSVPSYCFTFPNHGWFFEQWLAQQNGVFANNDNGRSARADELSFGGAEGLAVVEWLKEMYDAGNLYYSGGRNGASWGTVDQVFLTGQASMAVYSSSDTAIYTNTGAERGFEVVATRLPYNDATGWTGNLIGGASLWLANGLDSAVEDGALSFLFWLNNTTNAAEWHQVTGYMPVTNSAVELLSGADWYATMEAAGVASQWVNNAAVQASQGTPWFEANPNFLVAADQLANSTITTATSGALVGAFPSIRNEITAAIDSVLLGGVAPADALATAVTNSQEILSEYNLLNAE